MIFTVVYLGSLVFASWGIYAIRERDDRKEEKILREHRQKIATREKPGTNRCAKYIDTATESHDKDCIEVCYYDEDGNIVVDKSIYYIVKSIAEALLKAMPYAHRFEIKIEHGVHNYFFVTFYARTGRKVIGKSYDFSGIELRTECYRGFNRDGTIDLNP